MSSSSTKKFKELINLYSEGKIDAAFRNIQLKKLIITLKLFDVKLVNLQYGEVSRQIENIKNELDIEILDLKDIDKFNNIDGLASIIMACDTVISIDNAIVHLSGSLGVDTRVLLPFSPDARWGFKEKYSYWYSEVKLYRQKYLGEWDVPLKNLFNDLQKEGFGMNV